MKYNWDEMEDAQKMRAVEEEMRLTTHNGTTKDDLVEIMRFLSRQLAECQRALSLACAKLPAMPDELGRLEDMFLYQAAQAKAGEK